MTTPHGLQSFLRQQHARSLSGGGNRQLRTRTLPKEQVLLAAKCADPKCFKCHGAGILKRATPLLCRCAEERMLALQEGLERQQEHVMAEMAQAQGGLPGTQASVVITKPELDAAVAKDDTKAKL